jgi:hypothetical protein
MGSKKWDWTRMLLPCWRAIATLLEVVALNAFVSKSVDEEGSTNSTLGRASQKFSRVEASHRAGLVRVET